MIPPTIDRYFEPFLGAGSVYFNVPCHVEAKISDVISPLIECFRMVRDDPVAVHQAIGKWSVDREAYYRVRSMTSDDAATSAAQFIYLNKTAYNGLYRVNQSGSFNVPFGRPKTSNIVGLDDLLEASRILGERTSIDLRDFRDALSECAAGDFVYLDPPYVAGHRLNGFVDYNSKLFTWRDQEDLAKEFARLDSLGAYVVLSNADHESIRRLYDGFEIRSVSRKSTMAARGAARCESTEILVVGSSFKEVAA